MPSASLIATSIGVAHCQSLQELAPVGPLIGWKSSIAKTKMISELVTHTVTCKELATGETTRERATNAITMVSTNATSWRHQDDDQTRGKVSASTGTEDGSFSPPSKSSSWLSLTSWPFVLLLLLLLLILFLSIFDAFELN